MKIKSLKKENKNILLSLSGNNYDNAYSLLTYIRKSNINDYDKELIINDIYNIILEAERRGENLSKSFDNNLKKTADEAISEARIKSSKEKFLVLIKSIVVNIIVSLILYVILDLTFFGNFTKINFNIGVFSSMLLYLFIRDIATKYIEGLRIKHNKRYFLIDFIVFYITVLIFMYTKPLLEKIFNNYEIPILYVLICAIVLFSIIKLIENFLNKNYYSK